MTPGGSRLTRLAAFVLALLALLPATAATAAPPATPVATTPRQAVATFYRWYIAGTRSDHDPAYELSAEVPGLVTAALRAQLDARLRAGELPERDYFLRCPDTWRPSHRFEIVHLDVTGTAAGTARAVADLRLHAEGGGRWRVRAFLVREGLAWRIASVDDGPGR